MFQVFGHRGARGSSLVTENTVPSLKLAISRGADGLEFDVRATKDGKLILLHDASLDRTTDMKGKVADLNYEDIKDRVASLEEVLISFPDRLLNIELVDRGIAPAVKETLLRNGFAGRGNIIVSAFDFDDNNDFNYPDGYSSWEDLAIIRPEFPIALLAMKTKIEKIGEEAYIRSALNFGASAIYLEDTAVTSNLIDLAHDNKLEVRVFSVEINRLEDMERFREIGVDGMFFDFPE